MAFDIAGAKKAGYSDAEIAGFLGQQNKFDVPAAVKSGYTYPEIINHLSAPVEKPADSKAEFKAGLLSGTTLPADAPPMGNRMISEVGTPNLSEVPKFDVSKMPTEAERAAATFGLTPEMGAGEKALRTAKAAAYGASTALQQTWLGGARMIADMTGLHQDDVKGVSKQLAKEQGAVEKTFEDNYGLKIAKNIGESVLANVPTIYTGLAAGLPAAYTTMFGQSFLQTYDDSRNEGLNVAQSTARSALFGAAEVLGERIGLPTLFKGIKDIGAGVSAKELAKTAANFVMKDLAGEELTYLSQYLTDLGFGLNPQASLEQFFQGAVDTALVTVGQGAVMGGAGMASNKILKEIRNYNPDFLKKDQTVLQQGKNVSVEGAPPTPPAPPAGTPPAGPQDLSKFKALEDQDIEEQDKEKIDRLDALEAEFKSIDEKYKTATPAEFGDLNRRQGEITKEMNELIAGYVNPPTEAAAPKAPEAAQREAEMKMDVDKYGKPKLEEALSSNGRIFIDSRDEAGKKTYYAKGVGSIDNKYAVPLDLTSEEKKAARLAEGDLDLAETTEERDAAKKQLEDVLRPAAERAVGNTPVAETATIVAPPKTPEEIKPPRKIIPQEFTPEEIAFVGQVVGSGNGLQYNDEVKPVLKKFEKAGLLNIKNNKVYVSQEAEAAGIRGGDSFVRFTDSPDMDRVRAFLGYNLPAPKPTIAETKPAEPVNREAAELIKRRIEKNIALNVVSSKDGNDWYASGQRIKDQRYLVKLDLTPAEIKKAQEIEKELMEYPSDSDEYSDTRDKLSAHLTPAAKRAIGLAEEEKPKTKAEINKERQAKQKEAAKEAPKPKEPKKGTSMYAAKLLADAQKSGDITGAQAKSLMYREMTSNTKDYIAAIEKAIADTKAAKEKPTKTEVHIEGKKEEPVTSKTIEESMDKAETKVDAKKIKQAIKNQFDQAIKRSSAVTEEQWKGLPKDDQKVSINIPGDGTFTINNYTENLQKYQKRLMAATTLKVGAAKRESVTAVSVSSADVAFKNLLDGGDVEAAVEYAKLKKIDLDPKAKQVDLDAKQRKALEDFFGTKEAYQDYKDEISNKEIKEKSKSDVAVDDKGEKLNFPLFVDMANKGYKILSFDNPRSYTDKGGTTFRTIEKDGVRLALEPRKLLFKQQGKEYGRVQYGYGKEKDITFEHLIVDPNKRKQGLAKQAIQDLVDVADKNGYTIFLEPAQLEKQGITKEQLSDLYSKYGFVATNESGNPMERVPKLADESRTIDVEAIEITPQQVKLLTNQVNKLSDEDIATLEEHYGIPNSSMDFMKRIREDIITYTNKGAEAIDKAIRNIIAKLQAGMLSVAMVFNPAYMSEQSVVVYPSKVTTEEVRAEVPDSASEMSDGGKKAFSILFAALQPEMQANDKLFTIVDKPTSKAFVFQPNGSLLLKDNVVLGKSLGDVYVGQTEFQGNQITPAGVLRVKKEKGSATYDGKTIYTVGNVKEDWNVAFMHTVYLKEADAAARKQALATGQGTRLSHGCVNAQPEVMDKLEEGDRMDKSIVFVVPDDQTKVHDYIANTVPNEDLTRETIKPATKTTKTEEIKVERKVVGREQEATEPRKTQAEINRERQAKKRGEGPKEEPYIPLNMVEEFKEAKLSVDNPGGSWLKDKRAYSLEEGLYKKYRVPQIFGSVTASFKRDVLIPVELLAKVKGMRNEQQNVRSESIDYLTKYMEENKKLPPFRNEDLESHYAPFIQVYQDGTPYVNEGNHRIMVAKKLGFKYLPIEIRWFNGAEDEGGDFDPKKIIAYDKKAHEEGYTLTSYAKKPYQELSMLSPGAYERALNKNVNKDREESQQEYRNVRAAVRRKTKEIARVGSTIPLQKELNRLLESEQAIKDYLDATYKEDRRPIAFKLKAVAEEKEGNLAPEVSEFIQHIYATNPKILDGLQLSVRANKNPNNPSSANFAPYSRIVTLWKNGSGVDNPNTISHELTHSFEQMMDADTRKVVVDAWARSLEKAIKNYPGQKHQDYFDAVMEYLENPTEENYNDAIKNLKGLGYDFYQYLTPSEYWAVNGTDMFRAKLGTTWDKFVNSIKGLIEGLKSFFGMNNTYVVHKTMNKIFKGEMERVDHGSLIGYLLRGEYKGDLQNIEEEEGDFMDAYRAQREADGREDFKLKTSKSVKDMLLGSYGAARAAAKAVKESPMLAVNKMTSKLDRAITYARIKGVWYGRGLEVAEVKKFNGKVRDGQEKAIATVALTNALHSGEIMSQAIMRGKLMFDTKSQMFRAEDAKESLANVMLAKHDLIERVGGQEANNMIQDYFEAKRSRSILNAFQKQEGVVEKAKEKAEKLEFGTDAYYDALDEVEKAKNDFYNIAVARSKVKLSDESIDIYSALEDDNPELRNMMENWQAVNSSNLDNMEFSGLISKKRAKSLREIEDYVPWQRIQDEMDDVHSAPVRGSTKSLTNVAKEKVFKRNAAVNKAARDYIDGEIDLDEFNEAIQKYQENLGEIDDILDNMLHNTAVLGRNSMRNHAANMIASRYAERYTEGKKKDKLKLYREEGRDDNGVRLNIVVNGKRVIVNIPDPLIAEAVVGMENINMPAVEIFAVMANLLRRGITTWPQFQLRQLFMDAPTAAMVSGLGAKNSAILYADTFKSFLNALNSEDPIVRHLKAYGIGGFQSYTRSPEQQYKQQIGLIEQNKLDQFTNILDKIGDASDMAQRIATYKRVLAETGDETLALIRSNNIIDFKKHGNAKMVVAITRSVSFMNAYAQQLDVLAEALAGGGLKGKNRGAAFGSMLKVAAMLTMWTTIYTMIMGGDDDYEKMDDQKKARNFVIPKSLTKHIGVDDNILLPMNTSAAYFFKAMPELITNYVVKKGTKDEVDGTRLRKALAEAAIDSLLGPNPIATGIKPAVEIKLKHNFFTGGPITPKGLEGLDAAEQYNASTSELGKILSAVVGGALNPIEMDHLVRGIFGTNGAVVMWGSNMLSGERPTAEQKDNPLWGGLMDRDVGRGPETLFYDLKTEVEPKHKTFMKLVEREKDEEAEKYFNKHEKEIAAYEYVTGIESALKEINKEIRRVGEVRDPKFSKDDRRKEIQELQKTKNDILEDVIQIRKEAGL
jgi:predicted GNAT family acetyltransferase